MHPGCIACTQARCFAHFTSIFDELIKFVSCLPNPNPYPHR